MLSYGRRCNLSSTENIASTENSLIVIVQCLRNEVMGTSLIHREPIDSQGTS